MRKTFDNGVVEYRFKKKKKKKRPDARELRESSLLKADSVRRGHEFLQLIGNSQDLPSEISAEFVEEELNLKSNSQLQFEFPNYAFGIIKLCKIEIRSFFFFFTLI